MEFDARTIFFSDMAQKIPTELQDASLLINPLPIAQSDALGQPLAQRQPLYSMTPGQVMTDAQLETLRRQISVYATICQQLVEMHKAIVAQQSGIPGIRLGQSIPFDPAIHSVGQKLTSRQRWTPSQTQLQILEKLFEQGSGTPNKQRIKEITMELSQHGQISETNVYNWFQNRRARTKRKQQLGNNGESELDTDVDSPEEKRAKMDRDLSNESFGGQTDTNIQSCDSFTEQHQFDTQKGLQSSQMSVQGNNATISFDRSAVDGHIYAPGRVGLLVDCKPWDVPGLVLDIKNEHGGPLTSKEPQGQMVLVNAAAESLKLLHTAENYSLAE